MEFIMALDVSMGKSYAVIYQDQICLYEGEIAHNQYGFQQLLDKIQCLTGKMMVVFESTGIYSKPVEAFCQKNKLPYCLLNPLAAKKQLEQGTLRSWKTDKHDAHVLAQSHHLHKREEKVHQSDVYQTLRDLSRFYQEIEEEIKRMRMYLHNALQLSFPELEQFFSSRLTPYALALIELFPHPALVLSSSITKIKNLLVNHTTKNISQARAKQKAVDIMNYAQSSYPAVSQTSVHTQKVQYYARQLLHLLEEKERISREMITEAKKLPEFDLLISFPGIGEISAALVIGELGDLSRFSNHKKVNAFIGIDIRRYQSGKYTGQDHINKRGNPKGRKILYFIIRNMIRQQKAAPNHIVDYYYKLKKQPTPKKDKVAVVACMNKLIKCIYSMVRNNTKYDYSYAVSMDQ
ncbi:IS110 family transposase [Halalkalibacter sp. APA_J-10(15)]|uniref:IS110 family transposase n=1 Tax=Halalkalibacter sp. APA_J-10(15) TaxID=2933805 RepID=UPI001FF66BAB|nr:IS110 family transposase [Halalkalibacter sp. APA_J-10(15)]MCK0471299.1 IS110 family transposase [Halalkalibacter sp. APA_J-10(15)]